MGKYKHCKIRKNRTTNKMVNQVVNNVPMKKKGLYSMKNIEGTYEDLATWFTVLLTDKTKTSLTKSEIIDFLETKNRVPLGILKNNKQTSNAPIQSQDKCCARVVKNFAQCKNDSTKGESRFCKVHTTHPPKYTIDIDVNEIEQEVSRNKVEAKKILQIK